MPVLSVMVGWRISAQLLLLSLWLSVSATLKGAETSGGIRLPGMDDSWWHTKSPNFEHFSQHGEEDARRQLHALEVLRAFFIRRFQLTEQSKTDVTVYSFRHERDFRAYLPEGSWRPGYRGVYVRTPDRALILLAPSAEDDQAQRTVYHEYVHHLFVATGQDPSLWYNEGMAELFSSIREVRGQLEFGHPHPGRLAVLQSEKLLPLESLFSADLPTLQSNSNEHTGLFYAQAWALLHYWYFGESGISKKAVDRFLAVAADRKKASALELRRHFRSCFSMDYSDMLRQLDRYVSSGKYRFGREPLPELAPSSSYDAGEVPPELLRLRLADLALRMTRSPWGKVILLDAVAAGTTDPRPLEALGAEALRDGDESKAKRLWEQAETTGSTNLAMLRELNRFDTRSWFDGFNFTARLTDERVQLLRARLHRSIQLDPMQADAYETLAWVEALSARPDAANVKTVQRAFSQLVRQQRTLLALALVRQRLGLVEETKRMLSEMALLERDAWAAQGAEHVLAGIEGRPAQRLRAPRTPGQESVQVASEINGFLKMPSVELPEAP